MSLDGEKERTNDRDWASLVLGDRGMQQRRVRRTSRVGRYPGSPRKRGRDRGEGPAVLDSVDGSQDDRECTDHSV